MVLCVILMLVSSWVYAVLAMFLATLIYYYIQYNGAVKEWGDGLRGLSMQAAKFSLLRLEDGSENIHIKNWRPQLLVFSKLDAVTYRPRDEAVIKLIGQLKGGKGFTLITSILAGSFEERAVDARKARVALKEFMRAEEIEGFAEVLVADTTDNGFDYVIQGAGLGVLKHNTVVIGWPESWRMQTAADGTRHTSRHTFMKALRVTAAATHAVLVPKGFGGDSHASENGTLDIWWIVHDGGMLLLMAFLLQKDKRWEKSLLRLFCLAEGDDDSITMERDLVLFLKLLRIRGEVRVIEIEGGIVDGTPYQRRLNSATKVNRILLQHSVNVASLVMLSLPGQPPVEEFGDAEVGERDVLYLELVEALTLGLERCVLVKGSGTEVITIFN